MDRYSFMLANIERLEARIEKIEKSLEPVETSEPVNRIPSAVDDEDSEPDPKERKRK